MVIDGILTPLIKRLTEAAQQAEFDQKESKSMLEFILTI